MLDVGYATATPEAVGAFVEAHWGLGAVSRCVFASRGFNDIYRVEAGGVEYVFRLSGRRGRGAADVGEETAFLAHLAGAGVPVAVGVASRTGALWVMAEMPERARAGVLFEAVDGQLPGVESEADARAQGGTLALLHEAAGGYRGEGRYPLDAGRLLHGPLEAVRALGVGGGEAMGALGALVGRLAGRLAAVGPALTWTRLHGDCHGLNARIDADGRAVLFDFDDGGRGWLAYDLAVHLWAQVSFGRRRHGVWHAFLKGYRAVRPVGAADLAAVELFVPMRHVWLMGEFAGMTARWGSEAMGAAWVEREVGFLLEWERERLGPGLLGGVELGGVGAGVGAGSRAGEVGGLRREWPV